MTVLQFPATDENTPTDGSYQYSANGVLYSWDGEKWTANNEESFGPDGPFVKISGDNMTGDLTLGGDKVELSAGNGNIIAAGDLKVGPFDPAADNATGVDCQGGGLLSVQRASGSNASDVFRGYLGDDIKFKVTADGSIEAAGTIDAGAFSPTNGIRLDPSTNTIYARYDGPDPSATGALYVGPSGSEPLARINHDGSIKAAGEIAYVNPDPGGEARVFAVYNSGDGTKTFPCFQIDSAGTVDLGGGDLDNNDPSISLKSDGSITAAGSIKVNDFDSADGGIALADAGYIYVRPNDTFADNSTVFGVFSNGTDSANQTVSINKEGSANFKGEVKADNVTFNLDESTTLDVKRVGLALVALKAAAAASTDHASLKAAIATALADI